MRIYRPVGDDETLVVELHLGERILPLYTGPLEPETCLLIKNLTIVTPSGSRKAVRIN